MPKIFEQQNPGESLDDFSQRQVSTTESERRRSVKVQTDLGNEEILITSNVFRVWVYVCMFVCVYVCMYDFF